MMRPPLALSNKVPLTSILRDHLDNIMKCLEYWQTIGLGLGLGLGLDKELCEVVSLRNWCDMAEWPQYNFSLQAP